MADYFDNDTLITDGSGNISLKVNSGYGQPVATTVYFKNNNGSTKEIDAFKGNQQKDLGPVSTFRYHRIEIFSIVHDVQDATPGQEVEDIHLDIVVSGGGASVDASFIKKTKGTGTLVKCTYEVTIL
tara:strand:+ start:1216 stop:1596 length:381 start_codon:yes stop_codon:yes gene_type:complete